MLCTKNSEESDWRAEEDARTLMRAQEIQGDPTRAINAKKCIENSVAIGKTALSKTLKGSTPISGRTNKATILKL